MHENFEAGYQRVYKTHLAGQPYNVIVSAVCILNTYKFHSNVYQQFQH